MNKKKLIVIGGGAAGFFCAVNAARMNPSLEVIIVEKTGKTLSKVRVSGGGRCNVTHACFEISEMIKKYPRGTQFLRKTFPIFFTKDIITWFEERGVTLKTEEDGRMFPITDSSQTIIDCFLGEAHEYDVKIHLHAEVKKIQQQDNRFILELGGDRTMEADFVCIASGGYPKISMFEWLASLGHTIEPPVPSLFSFNMPGNPITQLMGVAVNDAEVRIFGTKLKERGPLLITHWGMSGPAILRLSAWGARMLAEGIGAEPYHITIRVHWIPALNEEQLRAEFTRLRFELASQKMGGKNPFALPRRLWDYLLQQSGISEAMRWADLPAATQNKLIRNLAAQEFEVKGKTTFKEEFVTAGGVRLSDIDPHTMQSKKIMGLFFAGEAMDVDGITGGFNFQHAWTSAFIAARAISGY
jgi:predicted Rossmann fold flavoprotein